MGYSLSLTAADSRAPSALPAAIAVAAFITCPICRRPPRGAGTEREPDYGGRRFVATEPVE